MVDIRDKNFDKSEEEESENEESLEESKHEEEDMLCRIFHGRMIYCHCNGIIKK